MIDFILQYAIPDKDEGFAWSGLLIFLPFLIGMSYLLYKKAQFNVSDPFNFNLNNNLSQDKLLTAYICLSARLIKSHTREAGEKVLYMNKYFSQHFPNQRDGFTDLLNDAYREEIDYMALLKWLNIKLPAHKDRIQIVYFLVGLSFIDGEINPSELTVMYNISEMLGISPKEYESIIAIYVSYEQESRKAHRTVSNDDKLKIASQVLGVSIHASMDEIKKAYRNLVKLHHPDRFFNESMEQQKIAEERFLHIQKAYEILEILKKTN